jgi:hypothetical protein
MGGNALAPFGARRVDKETATAVAEQVHRVLADIAATYGAHYQCSLIPAYFEKQDFGDLEFVLDSRFSEKVSRDDLLAELEIAFGSSIPSHNGGNVFSVGIPLEKGCLQVDLIGTPSDIFQASLDYFSWNDLGNLIGRIAHKFGFKYGHNGLSIVLRDGTHMFAEISVSKSTEEILTFLGYDYSRWRKGFSNRDEIYRFVASSTFFNKNIYLLENRNHISRTREKKRPVYMEFLEWMNNPPYALNDFKFDEEKNSNLVRLFDFFPKVKSIYAKKWKDLDDSKYIKLRFNANLVTGLTGRTHARLGDFMAHFKREHWKKLEGIRSMSDEEICRLVLNVEKELYSMQASKGL